MKRLDPKIKNQLEELRPKLIQFLKEHVTKNRVQHIIRVSRTAKKYAKRIGLDYNKAELSGLLHDIAKEYKNPRLLAIAKLKKIPLDFIDIDNPHILHARVGALIARDKFGIKDRDVLAGIRCHTLGEPYMSPLAMIVYLADSTEPGRDKKKSGKIRKTFKQKGLESAVLEALNLKLLMVIKKNGKVHPLTITARNWLIGEIKKKKKS